MTSVRSFLLEKRKKSDSKSSNLNLDEIDENPIFSIKKNGELDEGNLIFFLKKIN